MPKRKKTAAVSVSNKRKATSPNKKGSKAAKKTNESEKLSQNNSAEVEEETAYERLLRLVKSNRDKKAAESLMQEIKLNEGNQESSSNAEVEPSSSNAEVEPSSMQEEGNAVQFINNDMLMEMDVSNEADKTFPMDEGEKQQQNNNASVLHSSNIISVERSWGASCDATRSKETTQPEFLNNNPDDPNDSAVHRKGNSIGRDEGNKSDQASTFALMQLFMLKKGIISNQMTESEMHKFLSSGIDDRNGKTNPKAAKGGDRQLNPAAKAAETHKGRDSISSSSEITIYKRAVKQLSPELDQHLENLIKGVRAEVDLGKVSNGTPLQPANHRKDSFPSDENENMDTSDETINEIDNNRLINLSIVEAVPGTSNQTDKVGFKTPE